MPIEKINKAGETASNLNTLFKLAGIIISIILGAAATYYGVQTNSREIEKIHMFREQDKVEMEERLEVWGSRSDRRYKRLSEQDKELVKIGMMYEARLRRLEERVNFLEGRLNTYEK